MTRSELIDRLAASHPQLTAKDVELAVKVLLDALSSGQRRMRRESTAVSLWDCFLQLELNDERITGRPPVIAPADNYARRSRVRECIASVAPDLQTEYPSGAYRTLLRRSRAIFPTALSFSPREHQSKPDSVNRADNLQPDYRTRSNTQYFELSKRPQYGGYAKRDRLLALARMPSVSYSGYAARCAAAGGLP